MNRLLLVAIILVAAVATLPAAVPERAGLERFLAANGLRSASPERVPSASSDAADSAWDARFDAGTGPDNTVYATAFDGDDLYVGGQFITAGGVTVNGIARWDGSAWHPLGSGVDNIVRAIVIDGGNVYVAGQFSHAGGVAASGVARWDGSAWHPLGLGMNGIVYALGTYGGELYAGGLFTTAGGTPALNIARWNGSAWSALGSGMNSYVFAFAERAGALIAAGDFTTADGVAANRVASFDGAAWSPLGSGLDSYVLALTVSGGDLVAGGNFVHAGGANANRIARWDGSSWSALGDGMDNYVFSLAAYGPVLYAGGYFTFAGGAPASTVARWEGGVWSPLGSGTNGFSVFALAPRHGSLYVGGTFTVAGGKPSYRFGRWSVAPHLIAASASSGGAILPSGSVVVENGTDAIFQFLPDEGLHVDSIMVDGANAGDSTSYRFSSVFADHVISVAFAVNIYALSATAGPHGTVTPEGVVQLAHGADTSFTFTPDPGYRVDSIIVDGVFAGDSLSYRFTNVSAAHDLRVVFARNRFVVEASAGPGGTVFPSGLISVAQGDDTLFTFTPDVGLHVDSIIVDGAYAGDSLHYRFRSVASNHVLRAAFAVNVYPVQVSAGPHGAASPSGTIGVAHGSDLSIVLTPETGYELDSVLVDGSLAGTSSPFLLADVTQAHEVRATFRVAAAYETRFRTASYEEWALAVDQKAKSKSVRRKADKALISCLFVAPAPAGGFTLSADMPLSGVVSAGGVPVGGVPVGEAIAGRKSASFALSVAAGDTFRFDGTGGNGRPASLTVSWATAPRATKLPVTSFLRNAPGLPKPNLHNAGEELFGAGQSPTFPNGLLVGVPLGLKKGNSVIHVSYKDVLKSLLKRVKGAPLLHTGAPACIDTFPANRRPILKQLKSLPPDKFSNVLFAELLTLKLNIAASAAGKFPPGFGELTYIDTSEDSPFEGRTVGAIASVADSVISHLALPPGATLEDLGDVLHRLNGAFHDEALDTVSFAVKTVFTGARRLIDVPFLRRTPGLDPVIVAAGAASAELPSSFRLEQNYPNPFNPSTAIRFSLAAPSVVSVRIYDILGREVAVLADAEPMDEGETELTFEAGALASGVYLCRLEAVSEEGVERASAKMMLLR